MKTYYAVHSDKTHVKVDSPEDFVNRCLCRSNWTLVQADDDGWIPHTGNECPLPDDAKCAYRMSDGLTSETVGASKNLSWERRGYSSDITHYRPILTEKVQEPEQHKKMPDLVVTRDGIECADQKAALLEFKMQCLEASERGKRLAEKEAERKHMEIKEAELKRMMLLDRLKAAHEAAQTIPDLEAELREVLGSMGYDLVARSPFVNQCCGNPEQCWEPCGDLGKSEAHVAVSPEPDMTDWRNWREGDLIEVVGAVDSYWQRFYPVGSITTVVTDNHGDFGVGDTGGDVLTFGRLGHKKFKPECFRFHSRPAKGEK